MRYNLRLKIKNISMYFSIAKTQTLEGLCSLIEFNGNIAESKHIILWDLENCSLEEAKDSLSISQYHNSLSDIFILSDYPKSYRAICFTQINFKTLLNIILYNQYLDYNFFYWTVRRSKATIRYSNKKGRPESKVVAILKSDIPYEIPKHLIFKTYDTGYEKLGNTLKLEM